MMSATSKRVVINRAFLRLWWFPLLVAVVVVLGTVIFVMPQLRVVVSDFQDKKHLLSQLAQLQTKKSQVEELDAAAVSSMYQLVNSALPIQNPFYELLGSITDLAALTGVVVGDFDFNPGSLATPTASAKNNYVSLKTTLSISGTTDQVEAFVRKLHRALPLIEVTQIQINISQETELVSPLSSPRRAVLDLVVYYMRESAATTASTKPSVNSLPQYTDALMETYATLSGYSQAPSMIDIGGTSVQMNRSDLFGY